MEIVPDSQHRGLVARLPPRARDLALLARFDRPIGWWLLYWPCAWGVLLAGGERRWPLLLWLLAGAIAMRGAGCVYNDLVDADLDRRVTRTASRPIASGRVGRRAALGWIAVLLLIGLAVWWQLPWSARWVALGSVLPVAAYPFMKRITWWPQVWLGIVFSWGAPVGWIAVREHGLGALAALYAGSILWVVGYDTIYALQDREDDALVGIRSSARRLGRHARTGVAGFYVGAVALWALAFWLARPDPLAFAALLPMGAHLAWQAVTLRADDAGNALARFRSNRFAGLLMAFACWAVGNA